MIAQIFGGKHGGLLAKILPPGPAACWFGCPVPHGHLVQQVGASPCLGALAIACCDGLKSEMKRIRAAAVKLLQHLCGGEEHKYPQESGVEQWALGIRVPIVHTLCLPWTYVWVGRGRIVSTNPVRKKKTLWMYCIYCYFGVWRAFLWAEQKNTAQLWLQGSLLSALSLLRMGRNSSFHASFKTCYSDPTKSVTMLSTKL